MALTEVQRPQPSNWEDGLDWENPDLGDVRYLQALQLALAERCQTPLGKYSLSSLQRSWIATPSGTALGGFRNGIISVSAFYSMLWMIQEIAYSFIVPWEYGNYKPDLSDFPKRWDFDSLLRAVGGIPLSPSQGVPFIESGEGLRTLKAMISLLYLTSVDTKHSMHGYDSVSEGRRSEETAHAAFNNAIDNAGERPWRVRTMRNERYRISSHATMSVFSYDIHEGEKREVFYDCDIRDEAFKVVRAYGGEVLHPTLCLRCYAVRPENPYPEANISTVEYDAAGMGLEEGVVSERRFAHGTRDIVLHAPLENVPFPGEPQRDQWVQEEDCEYLPQSYITRGFEATVCPYLDFRSVYRFN